jgi:cation diffusion facilitator CzcD-associated flavoprotein CzcO
MPNYDAIVIGTGQSGPALARRLVASSESSSAARASILDARPPRRWLRAPTQLIWPAAQVITA